MREKKGGLFVFVIFCRMMISSNDNNTNAITANDNSANDYFCRLQRFLLAVSHSVLLAVEEAYNCLLDVEDIDLIRSTLGAPSESAVYV